MVSSARAMLSSLLCCLALAASAWAKASLPVVIWHGMGDSCCNPLSIGAVRDAIQKRYDVPVISINTGSDGSIATDMISSFYGNMNEEIARVCRFLREQDALKSGFNMIGFSQGGQFSRALVQRCGHEGLDVKTLITFGGQHQGIVNVPGCQVTASGKPGFVCQRSMDFLGWWAYLPWVRSSVVQAQYVKAPGALKNYLDLNPFLPDINNEIPGKRSQQYKANLKALKRLVLIRFKDDITVVPRDSAWFSWYNGTDLVPLRKQAIYEEDWLGLAEMDRSGRLFMDEVPGGHMQFKFTTLFEILDYYLNTLEE
eukprot:jgi/Ulvmu1/5009/UM021_0026.1